MISASTLLGAENAHLIRELRILENRLKGVEVQDGFVGCSPAVRRLAGVVDRAGENDATVLIEGNDWPGPPSARCFSRRSGGSSGRAS